MSEHLCPCCGQPLVGDVPADALKDAQMPPTARKIIDELASVYPRGLSRRALANRIYANDPTGGPDSAENIISVTMSRSRAVLAAYGWRVGADGRRAGQIKLHRIEDNAA